MIFFRLWPPNNYKIIDNLHTLDSEFFKSVALWASKIWKHSGTSTEFSTLDQTSITQQALNFLFLLGMHTSVFNLCQRSAFVQHTILHKASPKH